MFKRKLYLDKILLELENNDDILFLVGARQVGKTSLLKALTQFKYIKKDETLFLDGDRLLELGIEKSMDLENIIFSSIEKEKLKYLIIDEAQYIKNIGFILKIIVDQIRKGEFNFKVIISGSGSLEIFRGITDSLIGRKKIINIYPLSFLEFLEYKKYDINMILKNNFLSKIQLDKLNFYLDEFILYGSYPRVVIEKSVIKKMEILNNLYTDYIHKDIGFYLKEDENIYFDKFLKYIGAGVCSQVSIDKIVNEVGINRKLVKRFLFLVENTFILNLVPAFYKNKKKEISKPKKIYFTDLGFLRKTLGLEFINSGIRGKIIENFVFMELTKYKSNLEDIFYYSKRSQSEIDFILQNSFDSKIYPIEVKAGTTDNIPIIFKFFLSDYSDLINNFYVINNAAIKKRKLLEKDVRIISYLTLFKMFH